MPTTVRKKSEKDEKEPASDANYLVTYTRHLERRLKSLETEKQLLDTERLRLERELHALRTELDRLRQPPLIAATLIDVLEDKRAIVKSTTGPQFIVNMSKKIKSKNMQPGTRVALNQRTFAIVEDLPPSHDPFVKGMEIEENVPDVTYADVGGLDNQLREIRETVELPLAHPELFEQVGITPPKGVLLWGPPGTGKTLLAKAVAHETEARFIRIIGSELVQKFIGEGARLVREIFQMAKGGGSATIVFIDELDAIGSRRLEVATSGDREVQRTLMQLLSELDGFDSRGEVRILAATNRPDILDPALLRPGRFDRIIEFPKPDITARAQIFKIHTRKINLADKDMDFKSLVQYTENLTGADIKAIVTEAGMFAIRETRSSVTYADFKKAIEKVILANKKILGGEAAPTEMFR